MFINLIDDNALAKSGKIEFVHRLREMFGGVVIEKAPQTLADAQRPEPDKILMTTLVFLTI